MPDEEQAVEQIADRLKAYLRANPLACDTLEGIVSWWLTGGARVDPTVVERALFVMRAEGYVEALTAIDGRVRYRGRLSEPREPGDAGH